MPVVRARILRHHHEELARRTEVASRGGSSSFRYFLGHGVAHLLAAGCIRDAQALSTRLDFQLDRFDAFGSPAAYAGQAELGAIQRGSGDTPASRAWQSFLASNAHRFVRDLRGSMLQYVWAEPPSSPLRQQAERGPRGVASALPILRHVRGGVGVRAVPRRTIATQADVLATTEDGRLLTGGSDGYVRVWRAATGAPVRDIAAHEYGVSAMAVSADGRILWTGGHDERVRAWRLDDGHLNATLEGRGHEGAIQSIVPAADGVSALSASRDGCMILWNAESGAVLRRAQAARGRIVAVVPCGEGEFLAALTEKSIVLLDARTWRVVARARQKHPPKETAVTVSAGATGEWLVVGGWKVARVYAVPSLVCVGEVEVSREGAVGWPCEAIAVARGRAVVAAASDIAILTPGTEDRPRRLLGPTTTVTAVAWGVRGEVWTASDDGYVRAWDTDDARSTTPPSAEVRKAVAIVQSEARRSVTITSSACEVHSLDTGACLGTMPGAWTRAAVATSGERVVGAGDLTLDTWDLGSLRHTSARVRRLDDVIALAPEGAPVFTAGDDGVVSVWDGGGAAPSARLVGHAGKVVAAAVCPDGAVLASVGADRTVRLWDLATASCRIVVGRNGRPERDDRPTTGIESLGAATTEAEAADVRPMAVALGRHGRRIVTGDAAGRVCVWDGTDARCLGTAHRHRAKVLALALAPDEASFASIGDDGTLWVWRCDGPVPIASWSFDAEPVACAFDGKDVVVVVRDGSSWGFHVEVDAE